MGAEETVGDVGAPAAATRVLLLPVLRPVLPSVCALRPTIRCVGGKVWQHGSRRSRAGIPILSTPNRPTSVEMVMREEPARQAATGTAAAQDVPKEGSCQRKGGMHAPQ
jgi:hypothetical protein